MSIFQCLAVGELSDSTYSLAALLRIDKCLLLYLLVASLTPHCISGITAVLRDLDEDLDDILDLSNQHIYLNLQKARELNDFGIDSAQRNCSQKFLEFWNDLDNTYNTRNLFRFLW